LLVPGCDSLIARYNARRYSLLLGYRRCITGLRWCHRADQRSRSFRVRFNPLLILLLFCRGAITHLCGLSLEEPLSVTQRPDLVSCRARTGGTGGAAEFSSFGAGRRLPSQLPRRPSLHAFYSPLAGCSPSPLVLCAIHSHENASSDFCLRHGALMLLSLRCRSLACASKASRGPSAFHLELAANIGAAVAGQRRSSHTRRWLVECTRRSTGVATGKCPNDMARLFAHRIITSANQQYPEVH
jgi:hypothetical protein